MHRQRAVPLDQLRQTRPVDQLHRVPDEPEPSRDIVDVHDVRVAEPGRELRLAPEALDDLRVLRQRRVQDLERHLALQVQIPHAIDSAESALAEQREQLVVVAEGAAEPGFPSRRYPRWPRAGPWTRPTARVSKVPASAARSSSISDAVR